MATISRANRAVLSVFSGLVLFFGVVIFQVNAIHSDHHGLNGPDIGPNICPEGDGWSTHQPPEDWSNEGVEGATEYCWKGGSENSDCDGYLYTSSNPDDFPPNEDGYCELSHWSYFITDDVTPSDEPSETPTSTPSGTLTPTATPSGMLSPTPTDRPSCDGECVIIIGDPTPTPTNEPTPTPTNEPTPTPTDTPTDEEDEDEDEGGQIFTDDEGGEIGGIMDVVEPGQVQGITSYGPTGDNEMTMLLVESLGLLLMTVGAMGTLRRI